MKKLLIVELGGVVIARTTRGHRVLETSHPPVYYFPLEDVDQSLLRPEAGATFCEWKGSARYFNVVVGEIVRKRAAWSYPNPTAGTEALRDAVCVLCGNV